MIIFVEIPSLKKDRERDPFFFPNNILFDLGHETSDVFHIHRILHDVILLQGRTDDRSGDIRQILIDVLLVDAASQENRKILGMFLNELNILDTRIDTSRDTGNDDTVSTALDQRFDREIQRLLRQGKRMFDIGIRQDHDILVVMRLQSHQSGTGSDK